ncbi:hypothetical protein CHS0354_024174 [Potamilus streckersoni]|uniref:Uncharacterized protein n=1 Tax=Potamilus streckersoni TaxID=2493646 RepID=A0AAE0RZX7_9BIVA|nr:hypothetical protein CHS0354_024174 [Potamilus streckersoni]
MAFMDKKVFILTLIVCVESGCFNTKVNSGKNNLKREQIYEKYATNYFYDDADNLETRYSDEYEEEQAEVNSDLNKEVSFEDDDPIYLPNIYRNRASVYSPIIRSPYGFYGGYDGMGLEFGNNVWVGGYGRGAMFGPYYGGIVPNIYYSMGNTDWYWRERPYYSYYDYWRYSDYDGGNGGYVPQNSTTETSDDVNIRGRRFYRSNRNDLEGSVEKQQPIAQPQGGVVIPSWQNTNPNVTPAPVYSLPTQNYGNTPNTPQNVPSNSPGDVNNSEGGRGGSIQEPNSRRAIGRER